MDFFNYTRVTDIHLLDNSNRAKTAIAVFWIVIVFDIISLISGAMEISLLTRSENHGFISEVEATTNDLRQLAISILQFILNIVTVVVFLNWFRRAYANTHKLQVGTPKYSDATAVWSFFVPIISLFRPNEIMKEIIAFHKRKLSELQGTKTDNYLFISGVWWVFFVIRNIIGQIAFRMSLHSGDDIKSSIELDNFFIAADIADIIAAFLAIILITKVSKDEQELYNVIKAMKREHQTSMSPTPAS